MQSFVGKLIWAACVVCGGCIFLSYMYHLLYLDGLPDKVIKLSDEFQSDMSW